MLNSFEAKRQEFSNKYGINTDKYSSAKFSDEIMGHLEGLTSFGFIVLLPVIILVVLVIALSVYFGYLFDSMAFGALLFIFSIPLFLGVGSFGMGCAIKKVILGINFIICYTLNISNDIKATLKSNGHNNVKAFEISQFSFYSIVLPIVKSIIKASLLGGILFFFIEKIGSKGLNSYSKDMDNHEDKNFTEIPFEYNDFTKVSDKIYKKANVYSRLAANSIIAITSIIGFLALILGLILVMILFVLHSYL